MAKDGCSAAAKTHSLQKAQQEALQNPSPYHQIIGANWFPPTEHIEANTTSTPSVTVVASSARQETGDKRERTCKYFNDINA